MFPLNEQGRKQTGLNVREFRDASVKFPELSKPQPIGYFSVNTDRDYDPTQQQLRYYKPPPPKHFPLDLDAGAQLAIKKPECAYSEMLDHLLKFTFDNRQRLLTPAGRLSAEFVCWRGLLSLLMNTPYEFRDNWCILVTRYKGTFYLCKRDTEEERAKRAQETAQQRQMSGWGFKFEQYCLAESPSKEPDSSSPVDECSEFTCVFRTKVADMNLLYGAEMDGIVSEQPVLLNNDPKVLESLKFVELKTRLGTLNYRQTQSHNRHKTRKWWCQSFLVGINDLYVGLRTEKGRVKQIGHFEVRHLHKLGENFWMPTVCVSFLIEFLRCVRSTVVGDDCPHTTYEFYFNSQTSSITYECFRGKTEFSFLPDWYVAMFDRSEASKSAH